MKVRAIQNDTVDALCWRYLGATTSVVERTYELNPGLVNQGVILEPGTLVILPDTPGVQNSKKMVRLWD